MITIIKQLFSRRSDQSLPQSSTQNNGLFTRWQRRFAHVLSRHEKRLSTRQKKIILLT
ncbi:hypothetical protein HNQ91_000701 [Filimonas zeae]|uniref:hypothetical protein n=1 Tax=Filimonas zeae TaxID=1737353 RepID=UPI00166ECAE2|nr:hypothetical protein [Filimonas zeae]MDR6337679.1 hypothetical protein [Filimonas zeae]